MGNEDRSGKQDHLEEHSLPGTNQAGRGPDSFEENGPRNRDGEAPQQDQTEKHSLPGTNQAGQGPGSSEKNRGEGSPPSD